MSIREFVTQDPTAIQDQLTAVGIGGFTAMARVNESVSYKSQVPTTYLEDGTFAQDHVINEPIQLSISGVIADVSVTPVSIESIIPEANDVLETIASFYKPKFSPHVEKKRQAVLDACKKRMLAKAAAQNNQLLNVFGGLTNPSGKSLREQFVDAMEALHQAREIITIEMPYRNYPNMRIVNLQISKNNKEELLSFSLTATEVRFAEVEHTKVKRMIKKPMPGMESQAGTMKDKGKQEGKKVDEEKLQSLGYKGRELLK